MRGSRTIPVHLGFLHVGEPLVVHWMHRRARRAHQAEHADRLVRCLETLAKVAPHYEACDDRPEVETGKVQSASWKRNVGEGWILTIAKAEMKVKLSLTKRYAACESGV